MYVMLLYLAVLVLCPSLSTDKLKLKTEVIYATHGEGQNSLKVSVCRPELKKIFERLRYRKGIILK
jgi:hypothetical protein